MKLLRERGIITGYHAALDLEAAGRPVQALISVRIRPPARPVIEGFREWAAGLPETIGLFVTSGAHDFLIHIAVPDVNGCTPSSSTVSPSDAKWRTYRPPWPTSTSGPTGSNPPGTTPAPRAEPADREWRAGRVAAGNHRDDHHRMR
ncbi:Lrp/AsnC family transcriptional regulator [Streptomyces sp. M10(2022)]